MLIKKEEVVRIFKEADPEWLEEALKLLETVPEASIAKLLYALP